MTGILGRLGASLPVLAAPMSGGPTTVELVKAAAAAGGMGFLAGGYKTAGQLAGQVDEVRAVTGAFGVNLFVPSPVPIDGQAYRRYRQSLSGTLTPERIPPARPLGELLAEVRHAVRLPALAAGGIAGPAEVAALLRGGADAVLVGTALLLAPEAGTSAPHRAALLGPDRGATIVTRAFTGRPARALRNAFTDQHDADAPAGFPALHHLTSPLRRAAAATGDPEYVHLWAGDGYRSAREQPAGATLAGLAGAV